MKDLTTKGVPTHVVAVLNGPAGWDAEIIDANSTLKELYDKVIDESVSTSGSFVISNSTSQEDPTLDGTYHFATKIKEVNFKTSEADAVADKNFVEIFVERLAAKVQLKAATGAAFEGGEFSLGQYYVDGTKQNLTIKILGWDLNATAKNSYMIKNLPSGAASKNYEGYKYGVKDQWDWSWGDPNQGNLHRDYWGASVNYNNGLYFGSFGNTAGDGKATDKTDAPVTDANLTLNYISWEEIGKNNKFNDNLYCRENTNTLDVLGNKDKNGAYIFNGAVTSVLIAARVTAVGQDGNENGVGLVKYANTLFTDDNYLAYVANQLNSGYYVHWTQGEGDTKKDCWVKFDADFLEIAPLHDGYAKATLITENVYQIINKKIEAADESSEKSDLKGLDELTSATVLSWVPGNKVIPSEGNKITYSDEAFGLNDLLEAEHYKDGMMYYNIPIKHLRGGEMKTEGLDNLDETYYLIGTAEKKDFALREGDYGVVRNHYYQITVNKIENLGKAVSNGDEDIIPNTDFSELYYVGASINILSWKIVGQSVNL